MVTCQGCPHFDGNLLGRWESAHAWPGSELMMIDEAGHDYSDQGVQQALAAATNRFRRER